MISLTLLIIAPLITYDIPTLLHTLHITSHPHITARTTWGDPSSKMTPLVVSKSQMIFEIVSVF